jgi:guanine deaminase
VLSSKNAAIAPNAAIPGPVLTFTGDPFKESLQDVMVYESDAIVAFGDGIITHFGAASIVEKQLPSDLPITN